jgi:hypothetical protein
VNKRPVFKSKTSKHPSQKSPEKRRNNAGCGWETPPDLFFRSWDCLTMRQALCGLRRWIQLETSYYMLRACRWLAYAILPSGLKTCFGRQNMSRGLA